jgi:hypothetical protein
MRIILILTRHALFDSIHSNEFIRSGTYQEVYL